MLTHRGFKIETKQLTIHEKNQIIKDLTVQPEPYIGTEIPYRIYQANEIDVFLPRHYGIINYGNNDIRTCKQVIFPGEKIQFDFKIPNFSLRPIQQQGYKDVILAFKQYCSAILKLDCGMGKTVLAIYIAQKISRKTLVVVHRVNLLQQWKNEIEKYTNAKVGLIHRKVIDIDKKDIVLTTIHTVINKGQQPQYLNMYKRFCLTVLDECHHLSAREFCQTLQLISTQYMLGLTATPDKGTSLKINHVFKYFLGPIVPSETTLSKFHTDKKNINNVIANIIRYKIMDPVLSEHLVIEYAGKPNTGSMVNNIGKNDTRSDIIVAFVKQIIEFNKHENEPEKRKILIVSDRKYQLKYLHKSFAIHHIDSGLFIGGMSQSDLNNSKSKQVILGTYGVCEEGLNITDLNTIIKATPRRASEQIDGRALRKQHVIPVLILDFADYFSQTFINQSYARKKFYKNQKYNVFVKTVTNSDSLPQLQLTIPT